MTIQKIITIIGSSILIFLMIAFLFIPIVSVIKEDYNYIKTGFEEF
jgi:hypothetical protein